MQQFGVQFYQASLTANDIDKLVRFEVLSYGEQAHPPVRGGKRPAPQSTSSPHEPGVDHEPRPADPAVWPPGRRSGGP